MSLKATEVGKIFDYGTFYDLSTAGATFSIDLIGPNGTVTVPDARISAPAVDKIVETEQADGTMLQVTFPANTYMQFSTLATDFPVAGTYDQYTACGTYEDATPKKFFGDVANFSVGSAC
jgi:hypothetical protein